LEPFLHDNTEQFINEFQMFASCPFDMNTYDRLVRYEKQTQPLKLEIDTQTSPKRKELTTSNSKRPSKRVRTSLSSSTEGEIKKNFDEKNNVIDLTRSRDSENEKCVEIL